MKTLKNLFYGALFLALLLPAAMPYLSLAVPSESDVPGQIAVEDKTTLYEILGGLLYFIVYIFWFLVVIFIVFAAYLYLTSAGSDDKVKKANKMLGYAVVAIVVALIAQALPWLIRNIICGSTSAC